MAREGWPVCCVCVQETNDRRYSPLLRAAREPIQCGDGRDLGSRVWRRQHPQKTWQRRGRCCPHAGKRRSGACVPPGISVSQEAYKDR